MIKCKCGFEMRRQTQGVWYCSKGDYFAVALLTPDGVGNVQWYAPVGELETWDSFEELIKGQMNTAWNNTQRGRRKVSGQAS